MKEMVLLGIIFSMPAIFIILRNFLWDLSFWQKKNYSLERFSQNILWDLDKDKLSHNLIALKFIAFAFITLGFQMPIAGKIGIGAIFLIWTIEAFKRLENLFLTREPKLHFFKPRNLISILLMIAFLLYIHLVFTLPFISTVVPYRGPTEIPDFGFMSVYVYLILLSATLLFIDLATSLIVLIQQVTINALIKLKRSIKLTLFDARVNFLLNKNDIVLFVGNDFHEVSNLMKVGFNNVISINNDDPSSVKEYLLDSKFQNKTILVNASKDSFKKETLSLKPTVFVINTESFNLWHFMETIPVHTKLIINSDYHHVHMVEQHFQGKHTFFGKENIKMTKDANFIWQLKAKSISGKLASSFMANLREVNIELNTLNYQYSEALAISLSLVQTLEKDLSDFIKKVESKFKDTKSNSFIEGDNNTRILSFIDKELNYDELRNNIKSAAKHKEGKELILLTNGINKRGNIERFYEEIRGALDTVISNDSKLVKEMKKHGIHAFYADSFKNFTYLARKFSNEGDIILVEGHYREPLVRLLRKN